MNDKLQDWKDYEALKEDGALPEQFSGEWEEDKHAFMTMRKMNRELGIE